MHNLPQRLTMKRQPEKSASGLRFVNAAEGVTDIYLYDEISSWWGISAQDFVDQLKEVNTKKINLHINSPGGEIFDAQAIYNALKQHPAEVTTYIDALAASAASFIALAGDQVIAARNATVMIHDGIGFAFGNAADMRDTADILDLLSNQIADMYQQKAGGTVEEWRALMKEETWYNAAEAKDAGLVDVVLDTEDQQAQEETNKYDLSFFNYQGREDAPSPAAVRKRVLVNRVKEAQMGNKAPKNTDGTQEQPSTPSGNQPDESTETTDPTTEGTESTETGTETETGTQPEAPVAPSPATDSEAGNKLVSKVVNGVTIQVPQNVANHINALETFRTETIDQARRDFVAQLARDNKIAATMIDKLTNVALSLTDEQYADWAAAYDAAPASSLFANHGETPTDAGRPANSTGEGSVQDRINTLEAIVADHRRTGMPQEVLENKNSWKELQALKAQLAEQ